MGRPKKELQFGIYGIFHANHFDGLLPLYVGESSNLSVRITNHKMKLNRNLHIKGLQKYFNENCGSTDELEFRLIFTPKYNDKLRLMISEQVLIMHNKASIFNKPVLQFGPSKYMQFSFTEWDLEILKYI